MNAKTNINIVAPEEEVRQWFLKVLGDYGIEQYRLKTEYSVVVGGRNLRVDIAVFGRKSTKIVAIVECKAPYVVINESILRQAATYNSTIGAQYIIVTNGNNTFIYNSLSQLFVAQLPENL